jgi:hypothetical protein
VVDNALDDPSSSIPIPQEQPAPPAVKLEVDVQHAPECLQTEQMNQNKRTIADAEGPLGLTDSQGSMDKRPRLSRGEQWDTRFTELIQYTEQHGHCKVPRTVPILGRWVKKQREQFKLKREGHFTSLSDERLRRLNEVGFVWDFPKMDDWDTRFNQLVDYLEEHGNVLVPKKYAPNPSLGRVSVGTLIARKNLC